MPAKLDSASVSFCVGLSFNTCVRFRDDQTKSTNMASQTLIDTDGNDVDLWTVSDDSDGEADDRSRLK